MRQRFESLPNRFYDEQHSLLGIFWSSFGHALYQTVSGRRCRSRHFRRRTSDTRRNSCRRWRDILRRERFDAVRKSIHGVSDTDQISISYADFIIESACLANNKNVPLSPLEHLPVKRNSSADAVGSPPLAGGVGGGVQKPENSLCTPHPSSPARGEEQSVLSAHLILSNR